MYQALYRKYRPQTFKELAGQDPIAETLRNEVRDDRLAHAYLFTGPRGTGKTTSARLLAKALNCQHGPTADPCSEDRPDAPECAQCKAIRTGNHLDVVEIDAASNRGIDDIRSLQERVQLAPVQGRYKVFIIDEVHMLTDPAWNALLKTLEEPPPRCVFVMATTEVHKVLATVLSRCQRFDFQRIARPALVERLRFVASQEGIEIDDAALDILARRADGGLRDALSLLDQVAASTRDITAQIVYEALGMLPADQIVALGRSIAGRDSVGALETTYALLAAGHDHRTILRELLAWARNLMLLQLAPDKAEALDIPAVQAGALADQIPHFTQADLLAALEILRDTDQALRGSNQMTVWLEVGLLRLCDRTSVASLADLTARVAGLEAQLAGGAAPRAPAPRPAAPQPPARLPAATQPAAEQPATKGPAATPLAAVVGQSTAPSHTPSAQAAAAPPQAAAGGPRGEGGSYDLALSQGGEQDVYQTLYKAIDPNLKSKSAAYKQFVLTARRRADGTIELRTKKTSHYKEGGEQRKFLLDQAKTLWGPETRLEIIEDPDAARRVAAAAAPPPAPAAAPLLAPAPVPERPAVPPQTPPPAAQPIPTNGQPSNGHPKAEERPSGPPKVYDSGDPVALAKDIFLGKIIEGR